MKRVGLVLVILVFLLTACAAKRETSVYEVTMAESPPDQSMAVYLGTGFDASSEQGVASAPEQAVERMVIRNARLTLVVKDPRLALNDLQSMVADLGGYVVSSEVYTTTSENGRDLPTARITFRVPAEKLDEALQSLEQDALEVRDKRVSGQDITADYVDLQSRLRSLEAAEQQLEAMMQDASDMQDVIDIFNQLTSYREEIEQVKGQMQYYEQAVALSSVEVSLLAEEGVLPLEIGSWRLGQEARSAVQGLIYFLQGFLRFMVRFILYYLPVTLFMLIPFYLFFVFFRFLWRLVRGKVQPNQFFTSKVWGLYDPEKTPKKALPPETDAD